MRFIKLIILFLLFICLKADAQTIDTLIDLGSYKLHFKITKGKGTPILFESGGGLDIHQWDNIIPPLQKAIGTTFITYDREGFGKSGIDTLHYNLLNEIKGLETGLSKLGYENTPLILVCHSLGGFYARVYAARHPALVKGIVMFDPRIPSYADMEFARKVSNTLDKKLKHESPSLYDVLANMEHNSDIARQAIIPLQIPILDIMAEFGPYDSAADNDRFKASQKYFVKQGSNRRLFYAKGASHNIPYSKPQLAIDEVSSFYNNWH